MLTCVALAYKCFAHCLLDLPARGLPFVGGDLGTTFRNMRLPSAKTTANFLTAWSLATELPSLLKWWVIRSVRTEWASFKGLYSSLP